MTLEEVAIVMGSVVAHASGQMQTIRIHGIETIERKGGGILTSPWGRGKTITAARKDLAEQLNGKIAVKNAMVGERFEVQMPKTIHWRKRR
jgi:ribulose 1,5-bisphosphate carboxylase large subunit-like protein